MEKLRTILKEQLEGEKKYNNNINMTDNQINDFIEDVMFLYKKTKTKLNK